MFSGSKVNNSNGVCDELLEGCSVFEIYYKNK